MGKALKTIYAIRNIINGLIYIGASYKTLKRFYAHKYMLRKNIHDNKQLQQSWNQYGESAFEFLILEYVSEKDDLQTREQYWINYYDAVNPSKGFNTCKIACISRLPSENVPLIVCKRCLKTKKNCAKGLCKICYKTLSGNPNAKKRVLANHIWEQSFELGKIIFVNELGIRVECLIDSSDIELLSKFKWMPYKKQGDDQYRIVKGSGEKHLSRVLFGSLGNKEFVDHKNGNTLDNRRENLRVTTPANNPKNCKKYKNNTSGYKGVHFHKATQKFIVSIQANNKQIHVGLFDTALEGAIAYNEAAKKYHGEFARLNVLPEVVPV